MSHKYSFPAMKDRERDRCVLNYAERRLSMTLKKALYAIAFLFLVGAAIVPMAFGFGGHWEEYDSTQFDCRPPAADCYVIVVKK